MRFINILFTFCIAALLFSGCKPPVVFDEAYPPNKQNLSVFPEIYQGLYLCESDSAQITISADMITIREDHLFRVPAKNLETREICKIKGDTIYIQDDGRCYPIRFVNDSIVEGRMIEIDTLFHMGKHAFARAYKGNVILSQEVDFDEWAIHVLTVDDDFGVTYRAITDESDIDEVKRITPAEDITQPNDRTSTYSIKPTMIEFDELLKNEKIFIECDYLIRLYVEELIPWVF